MRNGRSNVEFYRLVALLSMPPDFAIGISVAIGNCLDDGHLRAAVSVFGGKNTKTHYRRRRQFDNCSANPSVANPSAGGENRRFTSQTWRMT